MISLESSITLYRCIRGIILSVTRGREGRKCNTHKTLYFYLRVHRMIIMFVSLYWCVISYLNNNRNRSHSFVLQRNIYSHNGEISHVFNLMLNLHATLFSITGDQLMKSMVMKNNEYSFCNCSLSLYITYH